MRTFFILSIFILTHFSSNGQILNPGFESWPFPQPVGWRAYWTLPYSIVEPDHVDSNAHSGFLAAKSEIWSILQCNPSGLFTGSEQDSFYLPITVRPNELHGWYILNSIGGDKFMATVKLKKNGQVIGYGQFTDSVSSTVYQEFIAYINYNVPSVPDSFSIALTFNGENPSTLGPPGGGNCGSYFIADDISFQNITPTAIEEASSSGFMKVYPVPVKDKLVFDYSIPSSSMLMLYNQLGVCIKILPLICEHNQIEVDVNQYPPGFYFYKVVNGNCSLFSGKISIIK